jgi:hypothetical protein
MGKRRSGLALHVIVDDPNQEGQQIEDNTQDTVLCMEQFSKTSIISTSSWQRRHQFAKVHFAGVLGTMPYPVQHMQFSMACMSTWMTLTRPRRRSAV